MEDVDSETEEIIQGTQNSASIFSSFEQASERRRVWRKSQGKFYECQESKFLGSVLDIISQSREEDFLTINAGKHDDNPAVWKDCEESKKKHRIFYWPGRISLPFSGLC